MLAVYTDKWAVLEETVKETLCVLTRNCVIIFCYDHLNRSSYGCSKICRKLERSTFNYELRVKFCFGARGRFIDGSTFCRYLDAFLWKYMAFQLWHPSLPRPVLRVTMVTTRSRMILFTNYTEISSRRMKWARFAALARELQNTQF